MPFPVTPNDPSPQPPHPMTNRLPDRLMPSGAAFEHVQHRPVAGCEGVHRRCVISNWIFMAPFQLISAKSGFTLKEGGDTVSVRVLALTHGLLASANILKTALYGWNPMAINLAQFQTLAKRMLSLVKLAAERDRLVWERLDEGWEALLADAELELGPKRMS